MSFAAEHDGLQATAERLSKLIGVEPIDGGIHPRFGTRNIILPLAQERYVEVVEVLDHPASDKAPFGRAVRDRSAMGGGWMGWVVRVDDLADTEERLGRKAVDGNRFRPDGVELHWKQIGINGLIADPQLPFFVQWQDVDLHPSKLAKNNVILQSLQIAGDPDRVHDWLGLKAGEAFEVIDFSWTAPHGTPGLMSVTFGTPDGPVTV